MRVLFALMLALTPAAVFAQSDDDNAHRSDRLQTQNLNRGVQRSVDQRNAANAARLARYRDAAAGYERRRAVWRRRVAACEDGDADACTLY